jgi:hypothetical protein
MEQNNPPIRAVYYVEVKEVVSRTYMVRADSRAEALRIMNHEQEVNETHHHYEFDRDNTYNVCEYDGSYQWHRSFKPTIDRAELQVFNVEHQEYQPVRT